MATLEENLAALIIDLGADIKALNDALSAGTGGPVYYPIYPPGTTPASGDPDGLVVQTT